MADEVLHSGVRGVTDLMVVPGLINLDFADIRAVMSEMGKAMMGTGEGDGEDRARLAAEAAISNPLLDDVSMKGARGVLINITGGPDMTLFEVDEAANRIGEEVDPDANIIFGSTMDSSLDGKMRVSVVATGIDAIAETQPRPVLKVYSAPQKLTRAGETVDILEDMSNFPKTSATKIAEAPPAAPIAQPPTPTIAAMEPMADSTPVNPSVQAPAVGIVSPVAMAAAECIPKAPVEAPGAKVVTETPAIAHSAPAAMTTAEAPAQPEPWLPNKNDAFMPPPPIDPEATSDTNTVLDPFKEADLVNGGSADDSRRKGPNLFQRITGAARDTKPAMPTSETTTKAASHAADQPAATPTPAAEKQKEIALAPAPQQARLAGVDPDDQLKASQSDDDLLEIPAFLRRQAN
jgi:cell division protein FtsZ